MKGKGIIFALTIESCEISEKAAARRQRERGRDTHTFPEIIAA